MRKNLVKFILLGSVITSFLFIFFLGLTVNAEEPTENQEPTTQEVEATTNEDETPTQENEEQKEEEDEKINEIVDFLSKLNKDELMNVIHDLKNWFIALGIVGIISLLSAILGLIAVIAKLRNEKIRNSQLTKEEQDRRIADNNNTAETIKEQVNSVKMLLLDFMNGLDDEDKAKVQSNIANVKARLLELEDNTKEE